MIRLLKTRSSSLLFWSLLVLFLILRVGVLWKFQSDLNTDPDAYLQLARNVAAGNGFVTSQAAGPTAYRPPLYPLLLVPVSSSDQTWERGLLHLLLSVVTFFAIWRTGTNLGLPIWGNWVACGLYAVDPLSLRYLSFPMTETLCACLVAVLMVVLTDHRTSWGRTLLAGIVFGLCVLARPTFWAFGILAAPVWVWGELRSHPENENQASLSATGRKGALSRALAVLLGTGLCVLPWTIRNWYHLGIPVFMTTHGGYTLLLGNNEAFYREVVHQPWGTIWDGSKGSGQAGWYQDLLEEIRNENISGEVETDRWMSRQARETIMKHPESFARACLLKFCWFWNVVPHGPQAGSLPGWVLWGVGGFYLVFWIAVLAGLVRIAAELWSARPPQRWRWLIPVLLVVSLSGAHLVYWSDARMRAPVTPALALIAARSLFRKSPTTAE